MAQELKPIKSSTVEVKGVGLVQQRDKSALLDWLQPNKDEGIHIPNDNKRGI